MKLRLTYWFGKHGVILLAFLLVIVFWTVPRAAYFIDYPVPILQNDSPSYMQPVNQMFSGAWPDFSIRSPGYPVFLCLCRLISNSFITVVIIQNILSLCSALFFVGCVHQSHPNLVLAAAIVMGAWVILPALSVYDNVVLSESIFASSIVLCLGFLLKALYSGKCRHYLLASTLAGYVFLVRPNGIFMLAPILVVALHLVVTRVSWRAVLALILPMPVIVLSLLLYNAIKIDLFETSIMGVLIKYGMTSTYWETSDKFPAEINSAILRYREEIPEKEREVLCRSWKPAELYDLYNKYGAKACYLYQGIRFDLFAYDQNGQLRANKTHWQLANDIAKVAIARHPGMYFKEVWCMGYVFFMDPFKWYWRVRHYEFIQNTYQDFYRWNNLDWLLAPWTDLKLPAGSKLCICKVADSTQLEVLPGRLQRMHLKYIKTIAPVFKTSAWVYVYLVVIVLNGLAILWTRFKDRDLIAGFALLVPHIASGILCALIASTIDRYVAPTWWLIYLSLPLGCLMAARLLGRMRVMYNGSKR